MGKRHRVARQATLHEALGTEPATAAGTVRCGRCHGYRLDRLDELLRRLKGRRGVDALDLAGDLRRELASLTEGAVRGARRDGATWQQVADALGMRSRQAAQQRYGTL